MFKHDLVLSNSCDKLCKIQDDIRVKRRVRIFLLASVNYAYDCCCTSLYLEGQG